ncbi:AbrB/MazE/SpoVT family DNA-binding domain-containing protein [Syntrophomonas wolfei]|uniref:Transcriptional regulator/antitoxin, MazE n=1 Tax=Syntrophomonas wolfei subsp. wolfei (strain DSM 2245B / Goettingen) TaxID=335541 RepID=Q0AVS9_SYNWW|nr:AbrB/MazE/SpoVT family DNA-binding domain-containing protein [Syntrophomonas wolfei]ABI69175.1 transcriptional regulator/antitoxin, MazE [Syntrophomonas wolfei subsp. wolfei str. Goettingen G311]
MKTDVIRIGNSKGIRIPATILKQCGIGSKVEIVVRDDEIILKPVKILREGWANSFQQMHKCGDDKLIIPDDLDTELLEEWDDN